MKGVILCGGQSSRMGRDKGLLQQQATTWSRAAFDKLASLGISVRVSVNAKQHTEYSSIFPGTELITDNVTLKINGPLLGVLSTHIVYPHDDLFVLACDMPLMESFLLKELFAASQSNPGHGAFVFTNDGEPEPLCAIYRSQLLEKILSLLRSGELGRHSMKFMLEHTISFTIPIQPAQKKFFQNINAHSELNGQ